MEASEALSDKQLVRRLQSGDGRAFGAFIDRWGGRVHGLVRRYASCEADAEDVTQEIFVDIFRGVGKFRGESSLATWVYRIALNHCLKHQARAAGRPMGVPFDEAALSSNDASDPRRQAERGELKTRVSGALAGLSPVHRDVVVLHEMHGLTYAECAAILGVPVGTVKSRLFNAFGRLRACLGGYVRGEEDDSFVPVLCPADPTGTSR